MRPSPLPLALLLPLLAACRSGVVQVHDTPPYPTLEVAELGSMRNVSRVGDVWFGSAPNAGDLDLAVRRGVQLVIDLSTPDEKVECDVAAVAGEKGLRYLDVGDSAAELAGERAVDLVLRELDQAAGQPVLLFCGNGGRCAAFVAIQRIARQGVPPEQALVEARRAGMKPGEPEDFVRAQVARLQAPDA